MTVSRTLREDPKVGPELRDRVLQAVQQLGYRRNDWARGLRNGRSSGLLGLAITHLGNPFYSQLAVGVEEVAAEHLLQLILGSTGDSLDRERALVEDLAARRVEGMVVVPTGEDQEHLDASRLHDMPVVLATCPPSRAGIDCVLVDDFGGAREASRRLHLEGHREVVFLGLPHPSWTGDERLRGFLAGRRELGVRTDPGDVVPLPLDDDGADAAMWALMSQPRPPTAVFAANNRNTLAACRFVRSTGRPLRVVGFDDISTASLFTMPVSLVSYSPAEVGRRAARMLVERIRPADAWPVPAEGRRVTVATSLRTYGQVDPLP